jgi:hypothetical protein
LVDPENLSELVTQEFSSGFISFYTINTIEREVGDNVVTYFVFKTFVSIITSLGYVGNKPC